MNTLESKAETLHCLHCGKPVLNGASFCCSGCESVHSLLVRRGLSHFYDMRGKGSFEQPKVSPPSGATTDGSAALTTQIQARFYIEGIHCLGCLWLLEKLPEIDARIKSASLDYAHGILEVKRGENITWPEISQTIRELGYSPRALAEDAGEAARRDDMRAQAIRLGVAAFSAGNIMLLTVAQYAGVEGLLAKHFQLLSFVLALPALTYSAYPLYKSAWVPLRHGRASVDLAVSFAVITGLGWSVFNLSVGHGSETYFDSLTMLVFLLLTSRFFLNRFRESLAKESACLSFLSNERYQKLSPKGELVDAGGLAISDRILLKQGQSTPTDCRLESAEAHFDYSLLTGESAPIKLLQGDPVDAGARLLSSKIELTVTRVESESRLAKILEQIRSFRLSRSPSLDFADRIGQRFVYVVLALAIATSFLLPFPTGIHRALVLIIVTCPCVLAFAVPLAFTRTLQQAARAGILFRATDKIEALADARTAFLDKTGTLTEGNFELLEWDQVEGNSETAKLAVLALESKSSHPIAKALVRSLPSSEEIPAISEFEEIAGYGVKGIINGRLWEVMRLEGRESPHNLIGVFRDGVLAASISLGDRLRPDALEFVSQLRSEGLEPMILSGDSELRVSTTARALGIYRWRSRLSPEEKANFARLQPHSVMIGDGANDAVAFQAADVGIAVQGAMDLSLKNADVALASPGLGGTLKAIQVAKRAMLIVRTNFAISLAYNLVAGLLALSGAMSPLLAAALMPLSAFSVFAFTQASTKGRLT